MKYVYGKRSRSDRWIIFVKVGVLIILMATMVFLIFALERSTPVVENPQASDLW